MGSVLDLARASLAAADLNGNDQGDLTGTVGDATGTGHGDHGGSHLSGMLATIAGVIGIPEADLVASLQSGQSPRGAPAEVSRLSRVYARSAPDPRL